MRLKDPQESDFADLLGMNTMGNAVKTRRRRNRQPAKIV